MPAPIALGPLAWTALRLGAFAAVALYASRNRASEPKDAERETMLDELPEGLTARPHISDAERAMHGTGRFHRVFRLGAGGPGVEIDAAALGRLRMRKIG